MTSKYIEYILNIFQRSGDQMDVEGSAKIDMQFEVLFSKSSRQPTDPFGSVNLLEVLPVCVMILGEFILVYYIQPSMSKYAEICDFKSFKSILPTCNAQKKGAPGNNMEYLFTIFTIE